MDELFSMTLEPSSDVLVQEVAGEAVLLDLASEQYFGLNQVGVRVWQILTEHGSPARAVEILLDEYEVDEETLREDVATLVTGFLESGLMQQQAD
jgi:hypothetical protein